MIIIFILGWWNAEERLSSDELKNKATKTPNIKGVINDSGKNELRSPKAERSDGLCWGICKEICCSWWARMSTTDLQEWVLNVKSRGD